MNAAQVADFASKVTLISQGDYEGLPAVGTDRAGLAECAKINAVIGDGPFTVNHLKAYDAMLTATAPKTTTTAKTAAGQVKLKWAKFDDSLLSSDALELYQAYRQANVAAAKARTEFEELGLPEIQAAVVKATGKQLPAGKGVLVTYKFGRINVAVADATEVTKSQADLSNLF